MKFIPILLDETVEQMYHKLRRAEEDLESEKSRDTPPKYEVYMRSSKVHGGNSDKLAEIMRRCGFIELIGESRTRPDVLDRFNRKYYAWNHYRVTSFGAEFIEKSLSFEEFCQIVRKEQWKYYTGFSGGRPEMLHWVIVALILGYLFT